MKTYVGVKVVKAKPTEKYGKPGYNVKYPDGYRQWVPADVFEKMYRELDCKDFINEG